MDGSHDFDFIYGRWRIQNRRLDDPLDEEASDWLEFEATSEARPILGGRGNVDTFYAPTFPGRPEYHGLALRLFDADAGLWRIWWASTVGQGRLDAPLVGRFRDGLGTFECDDMIDGREVRLRFFWKDITDSSATWEQAFSFDGGRSFTTNWVMRFDRVS